MNLNELFELQAKLDERIYKEHPPKEGEDRLAKKILALMVELGELCQEWRGFKFWSYDQEPRIKSICTFCKGQGFTDHLEDWLDSESHYTKECEFCGGTGYEKDKNPLLEEFVDCLHFVLSIGLELNFTDIDIWKVKETTTTNQFIECLGTIYNIHFQKTVNGEVPRVMYEHLFAYFLSLGEMLGFTWEQIEQMYMEKNRINHQRQLNHY